MCDDIPDADLDEAWLYGHAAKLGKKPSVLEVEDFIDKVLIKWRADQQIGKARLEAFKEVFNAR